MKEKLTASEAKIRKGIQEARAIGTFKYLNKDEASQYGAWARAQLKDERVNLRVSSADLAGLKLVAAAKGLKYQTYLGQMIHREAAKAATISETSSAASRSTGKRVR
jgi:predicted DNA binding CopG/RHH family protein